MTRETQQKPDVPDELSASFFEQVLIIGRSLRSSEVHLPLGLLSALILSIILATTYMQVALNHWNAPFYQAIEDRNRDSFISELITFGYIAIALTVLNVAQTFTNRWLSLTLRRGIVASLLDIWWAGGQRLIQANAALTENADQRIHSDAQALAESTTALSVGLVQAIILLCSFVTILWELSSGFQFQFGAREIMLPGYLVWAALAYAVLTSGLNRLIGRNLVTLNSSREAHEAALRASLVRADIALRSPGTASANLGFGDVRAEFKALLNSIRELAVAQTNLTWVSAGFGWLALIVPIVVAAPVYFSGGINFGGLMMAVGAFNQVHSALRWNVNNFLAIAEWRAHLLRVSQFHKALS